MKFRLTEESIERKLVVLRGHKVLLDFDLATMYGVSTGALNQAVRRNRERFPADFMLRLGPGDIRNLKCQIGISSWGGRRHRPCAFTEQGVAMLSSVLRSPRAIKVNIAIMRAFVRLRRILSTNEELARKIRELEKNCDHQFGVVFEAIRELLNEPEEPPKRRIGYHER